MQNQIPMNDLPLSAADPIYIKQLECLVEQLHAAPVPTEKDVDPPTLVDDVDAECFLEEEELSAWVIPPEELDVRKPYDLLHREAGTFYLDAADLQTPASAQTRRYFAQYLQETEFRIYNKQQQQQGVRAAAAASAAIAPRRGDTSTRTAPPAPPERAAGMPPRAAAA